MRGTNYPFPGGHVKMRLRLICVLLLVILIIVAEVEGTIPYLCLKYLIIRNIHLIHHIVNNIFKEYVYGHLNGSWIFFLFQGRREKGKVKREVAKGRGLLEGYWKAEWARSVQLNPLSKHQNGKMTRKKSRKRYL